MKAMTIESTPMNQLRTFTASASDAGSRLDEFLAARLGELSRMRIARLVALGVCSVNGAVSVSGSRVAAGDEVRIDLYDAAPTAMNPEAIPLEIAFEDEHILVVSKPSGMLVHPTRSVKSGTLANALAYHLNVARVDDSKLDDDASPCGPGLPTAQSDSGERTDIKRPGIVHRLDRATSGLLVIAKEPKAHSVLSRHFQKRLIEKRYLALLAGVIAADSELISAPIGRVEDVRPYWRVVEGGKAAETRLNVLERFTAATLVELEPVTGRTNQLRIHCSWIGHAVLGDEVYASKKLAGPSLGPSRLFLHAWRLAFHHPSTGAWMEFKSPLPQELDSFLEGCRNGRES